MDAEYRQAWNDWDDRECENERYQMLIEDIDAAMTDRGWWKDYNLSDLADESGMEPEVFDILWAVYKNPKALEVPDDAMVFLYREINRAFCFIADRYIEAQNDNI